ncbi:MAG: PQQ-like beta-propeller repeat protein [Verrucomicrobiales bacterium]|nr:PQQ-like beta-propeller repeat protein [Verrucomicrobiales bacterium]
MRSRTASLLRRVTLGWVITVAVVRASASDWPTYRADNSRSGVSPDDVPGVVSEAWVWRSRQPPRPAWQGEAKWDGWNKVFDLKARQTFDRAFHAVVSGDRVYFGSSADDKIYCLDAVTGREVWTVFTEGPVRLAPTIANGRVYVGSDDGHVYCLDAQDGHSLWNVRAAPSDRRIPGNGRLISAWPVRTSVVVADGIAYTTAGMFPSEGVHLLALDAATGAERWRQIQTDLPAQGYLLASPTRLYIPAGRDNPVVCDRATGKRIRVVDGNGGTYALLAGGDSLVFGPGKTGQLNALDEGPADQLATFQGNQMIVAGDRSYLHSDTELSALDRGRYLQLARERKAISRRQGEIQKALRKLDAAGGGDAEKAKLKSELAELGPKLDARTQSMEECLAWKIPCRWPLTLVLAGTTLAAGGQNEVAGFQASDGKVLWTRPVTGAAYGIAAAGGALFVSTDSGSIHCFRGSSQRASLNAPAPAESRTP